MANLPRFGRTWQRFSSLPRPATATRPEVQPTTDSEVFPAAPTTTNILQTSPIRERSPRFPSPVRKFPSPPSSPKYRATAISPPKPLSPTPTYNRYNGERRTSATSSPKTLKPTTNISPPLSPPKHKYPAPATIAAALSPLNLPRSEVRHEPEHTIRSKSPPEVEQKSILYQKETEKPTKTDHRPSEYSSGKPHQKHQHQHQHQQQQSDVINIKGENVGAVMHITQSPDGTEIHKKKPNITLGHSNEKEDQKANKSNSNNLAGKSFMNSNFQGVNNSILYNSSLSHRDPGLHLAFSKKPNKNNNHGDSLHT